MNCIERQMEPYPVWLTPRALHAIYRLSQESRLGALNMSCWLLWITMCVV